MSTRRRELWIAAFSFVLAIFASSIRPLWLDEILQLIETRRPSTAAMIGGVRHTAGAAPLGYLTQQIALRITGYSAILARLPSALFGAVSVFVVALIARRLGLRQAWLPAAIFALFPLALRYAAESRPYSQALFLSALATYLYLRVLEKPSWIVAALYCLTLIAAIYTQPYAVSVAIAHLLHSIFCRARRAALLSGAAFGLSVIAFIPWFFWARRAWAASSQTSGFRFSFSIKTPLMLFREFAGAGYWGSGLLLLLCAAALSGRCLTRSSRILLVLLIATIPAAILCGDARFGYFIAARQMLWILPAVAILAAAAIEHYPRSGLGVGIVLALVCVRQSVVFFRSQDENWHTAASALAVATRSGDCLAVAPPEQVMLYRFFEPNLGSQPCHSSSIVLAITPAATEIERHASTTNLTVAGYCEETRQTVGRSEILLFRRR